MCHIFQVIEDTDTPREPVMMLAGAELCPASSHSPRGSSCQIWDPCMVQRGVPEGVGSSRRLGICGTSSVRMPMALLGWKKAIRSIPSKSGRP